MQSTLSLDLHSQMSAFSNAQRTELEKTLGGDLLLHIMETSKDKPLSERAANKLKTMGWIE